MASAGDPGRANFGGDKLIQARRSWNCRVGVIEISCVVESLRRGAVVDVVGARGFDPLAVVVEVGVIAFTECSTQLKAARASSVRSYAMYSFRA
jgi:hypothetical protein